MKISPFFSNLRSAYEAELDDLAFDTEGRNVLEQRIGDKVKGFDFLLTMMQSHPEMVAVVFHKAFAHHDVKEIQAVLAFDEHQVPSWPTQLGTSLLNPAAQALANRVLQEPAGPWFMTVAAALEYLQSQAESSSSILSRGGDDEEDEDEDERDDTDGTDAHTNALDSDEQGEFENQQRTAQERDEAGADWLEAQGFDRKN